MNSIESLIKIISVLICVSLILYVFVPNYFELILMMVIGAIIAFVIPLKDITKKGK